MTQARWRILFVFAFCLAEVACQPEAPDSRALARLTVALRDSLGRAADPNAAFITDGGHRESHLYLTFDTTAVPNASDSVFEDRARDLARFAVSHYERASDLDSITVATRELVQPGAWRVHHRHSFVISGLKVTGAP